MSFRGEVEQGTRLWDGGFAKLLFVCTRELLGKFRTPIALGILQNCFSFGRDFVLDKSFWNKYHDVSELRGVDVVRRGVGSFDGEQPKGNVCKRRKCNEEEEEKNISVSVSVTTTHHQSSLANQEAVISSPFLYVEPSTTNTHVSTAADVLGAHCSLKPVDVLSARNHELADIAVSNKCSVVVVGSDSISVPVVYYDESCSYSNRLAALEKLNKFIDGEIAKLKN